MKKISECCSNFIHIKEILYYSVILRMDGNAKWRERHEVEIKVTKTTAKGYAMRGSLDIT